MLQANEDDLLNFENKLVNGQCKKVTVFQVFKIFMHVNVSQY